MDEITPYATVEDLERGWKPLDEQGKTRAAEMIKRATVMLHGLVKPTDDPYQPEMLRIVCLAMVQRAMSAGESSPFGASQTSMAADGFSESASFSNPSGDMYLTKTEKRLLGVDVGKGGMIKVDIRDDRGESIAW